MVRKPKDKDFVETVDGLFLCVVGYLHPPDAFTAYLSENGLAPPVFPSALQLETALVSMGSICRKRSSGRIRPLKPSSAVSRIKKPSASASTASS